MIQSPYSLRCSPQGLGPMLEALEQARTVVEREANSVNDNPLILPEDKSVLHGGHFYGGHVALAMDTLKTARGFDHKHSLDAVVILGVGSVKLRLGCR